MRPSRILLAAVALIAGGYAVWSVTRPKAEPATSPPPVPVTAAPAKEADVPVYLTTIGTVRPLNTVDIRPQVGGVLIDVPVKEGDEVKKGQVLALIDPRPLKAALEKAQAQLTQDKAQLANAQLDQKRYSVLASRDFASRQQLDTQNATVDRLQGVVAADQASIDQASINLSFSVLTAPFDGRIGIRQVDPGNLIQANGAQAILTVVQERPTSVIFNIPETELPSVRDAANKGTVPVLADKSDDKRNLGSGELKTIDNAVDSNSGTIEMRAVFPNTDGHLTAGQFVDVRLQVAIAHGVVVPHNAVQHGQDGLFLFTIGADKVAKRQNVKVAYDDGNQAVVSDGVAAGATVVTAGQSRIGDGTKVAYQGDAADAQPQQSAQR